MTEFPTCSTCRFLVKQACWRMPPIDKYGERPPIAFPDKEWCGEHQFAEGPAVRIADKPPTYAVTLDALEPIDDPVIAPVIATTPDAEVLPLSSPPRRPKK